MNEGLFKKLRRCWRAEFLSPKDFLQRAAIVAFIFLMTHLAGLREFTSILNGTVGSVEMSWQKAAFLGVLYLILYMAFILIVPILIIAAAISTAWQKLALQKKASQNESGTNPPNAN